MTAWADHCGDMWRVHVLGVTGRDICDIVGPSPRRPRDWAAMMRRIGVRSMDGVIGAVHGQPVPYRQAMRNDVVRRGWAIGVCRGDQAEFWGGEMVPMREVDRVWCLGSEALLNQATDRFGSRRQVGLLPAPFVNPLQEAWRYRHDEAG